jgi:lipopolysaccharide/colanic/teichoic acid biosynthesis glycosyltransferase
MIFIALIVKLTSKGPALYWSDRIGKDNCLVPGVTGWAQINGLDELPIPVKVEFDFHYLHHRSQIFDMKILFLTLLKVLCGGGVTH